MPGLFLMPLGLMSRFPPFSTVISNVPGPRQTLYWEGARLDGMYPASIVTEGIALNITLVTYDKNVDFGITACRRSMPQVQRLIDYMDSALVELENALGIKSEQATSQPSKSATESSSKTGPKTTSSKKKVSKNTAKKTAKKVARKSTKKAAKKTTKKTAKKVAKKSSKKKVSAKS
jgi:hypothetical protein